MTTQVAHNVAVWCDSSSAYTTGLALTPVVTQDFVNRQADTRVYPRYYPGAGNVIFWTAKAPLDKDWIDADTGPTVGDKAIYTPQVTFW